MAEVTSPPARHSSGQFSLFVEAVRRIAGVWAIGSVSLAGAGLKQKTRANERGHMSDSVAL